MQAIILLGRGTLDTVASFGRALLMLLGAVIALPKLQNVR